MTANELRTYFNNTFGVIAPWPKTFEVDAETYGHVCQEIFDEIREEHILFWSVIIDGLQRPDIKTATVMIGPHDGIMFKNVELILKEKK